MPSNLVTIATFPDWHDANLAKQYLDQEGIAVLLQEEAVTQIPIVLGRSVDLGRIQLQVPTMQVERANQLLMTAGYLNQADIGTVPLEQEDWGLPSWANQTAKRAFRVAIIGLWIPFLQFYSIWLLIRLLFARQSISRGGWLNVVMAVLVNAMWLRLVLWILFPG